MDVLMPQLGETVTEGTVTAWHKAAGDPVKADEVLFEVSTDKVDTEVPSPGRRRALGDTWSGRGDGPGGRQACGDRRPGAERGSRGPVPAAPASEPPRARGRVALEPGAAARPRGNPLSPPCAG